MDDEDVAQASIALDTKQTPLYRIWPASDPVLDTTPDPTHGTQGWHVHAWKDEADWKAGKKAVDQTYLAVTVDGRRLGKRGSRANIGVASDDARLRRATCPECGGLPKDDPEQSCAVCEDQGFLIEGDGYWHLVIQAEREQARSKEDGES